MDGEKMPLMLETYEYGIVFHALKEMRDGMMQKGSPTDTVDDILLRLIRIKEGQTERGRTERRKCYDAR